MQYIDVGISYVRISRGVLSLSKVPLKYPSSTPKVPQTIRLRRF